MYYDCKCHRAGGGFMDVWWGGCRRLTHTRSLGSFRYAGRSRVIALKILGNDLEAVEVYLLFQCISYFYYETAEINWFLSHMKPIILSSMGKSFLHVLFLTFTMQRLRWINFHHVMWNWFFSLNREVSSYFNMKLPCVLLRCASWVGRVRTSVHSIKD